MDADIAPANDSSGATASRLVGAMHGKQRTAEEVGGRMVYIYMQDEGYRDIAATLYRLKIFCASYGMRKHVAKLISQRLIGLDSEAGEIVPQPFDEA